MLCGVMVTKQVVIVREEDYVIIAQEFASVLKDIMESVVNTK